MVPMFGFGMTQYRLVHDLTEAEYAELSVPVYAPAPQPGSMVMDDAAIDAATDARTAGGG